MKKIPCVFVRMFDQNPDRRAQKPPIVTAMVTPGCEWVIDGKGVASRKRDGTACAVIAGALFKRYDAKKDRKTGEYRMPPDGSLACDLPDPTTGHWPHWVAVGEEPESQWHREAWGARSFLSSRDVRRTLQQRLLDFQFPDEGTYELCGPKVGGNAEGFAHHVFIRHGIEVLPDVPRTMQGLQDYFRAHVIEGVVFAHPDGRMAKIRRADFGLPWPAGEKR